MSRAAGGGRSWVIRLPRGYPDLEHPGILPGDAVLELWNWRPREISSKLTLWKSLGEIRTGGDTDHILCSRRVRGNSKGLQFVQTGGRVGMKRQECQRFYDRTAAVLQWLRAEERHRELKRFLAKWCVSSPVESTNNPHESGMLVINGSETAVNASGTFCHLLAFKYCMEWCKKIR